MKKPQILFIVFIINIVSLFIRNDAMGQTLDDPAITEEIENKLSKYKKDFEEIERDEELRRAYKRGFEDGSSYSPTGIYYCRRCDQAGRIMILWNQLKIFFGSEICELCGSSNVLQQGFEHNHRHHCLDCGHITVVTQT